MDSRLEIMWDGSVSGLTDHRISLDAFGKALPLLLVALRRIATNMLADALEPSRRGRFQKHAKLLDIEIDGISRNSSGFTSQVVLHPPKGESMDLFEDLTRRSVEALLTAIEAEAEGTYRNVAVRNYLRELPADITGQRYRFISNGATIEKSIGDMKLLENPPTLPFLFQAEGFITGVAFRPGKPAVYVETEDKQRIKCDATESQVEAALGLREKKVAILMVTNGSSRLLHVWAADEAIEPLTDQQREMNTFGKWDNLLRRLAK